MLEAYVNIQSPFPDMFCMNIIQMYSILKLKKIVFFLMIVLVLIFRIFTL